jgi:hypothetical protein
MFHERHWTAPQANAMRGWVARHVERVRAARDRLVSSSTYALTVEDAPQSGGAYPGADDAGAALELVLVLQAFERLEIVVRDLDRGLIDFPALRGGEEVYLCWLLDEPEVAHWHAIEAGFPGRRPLEDEPV